MTSKGKSRAKGSVAASAESGGATSAAFQQENTAHQLYTQLKQRIAVAQLVPEANRLVERSPSALSYQIRVKLAFAQLMEAAMQLATARKEASPGERPSQRILVLAGTQGREALILTKHALKGVEEHASLICLAYYIKASLLLEVDLATVKDHVQRIMDKYKDPDLWLDPQKEAFEEDPAQAPKIEEATGAEPRMRKVALTVKLMKLMQEAADPMAEPVNTPPVPPGYKVMMTLAVDISQLTEQLLHSDLLADFQVKRVQEWHDESMAQHHTRGTAQAAHLHTTHPDLLGSGRPPQEKLRILQVVDPVLEDLIKREGMRRGDWVPVREDREEEEEEEEMQQQWHSLSQHKHQREEQQRLPKKSKGGSKASKTKSKGGKEKDGEPEEPKITPQGLPQDRVAKIKPFWETVSQEDRVKLLSIPLSELKQRAAEVGAGQRKEQAATRAELAARLPPGMTTRPYIHEPTVDELLPVGIQRLQENKTWKLWKWPPAAKEFLTAGEFMLCIEEDFIDEKLRHLLPHNEGRPIEKAAAQALRQRMTELLKRPEELIRQQCEQQVAQRRVDPHGFGSPEQLTKLARSCNMEQIHIIMQALEDEHEYL